MPQSKPPLDAAVDPNIRSPTLVQSFIYNWLITDPSFNFKTRKNYQVQNHDSMHNIYFLGGRLRTIKAPPLNITTMVLIILPGVLFGCYEAKWMWYNFSPAVVIIFSYLWLLTISFFIKSAVSDPGILPRNIHLPLRIDKKTKKFLQQASDDYSNVISLPHQQVGGKVVVKYCPTCHIWRPPRSSHCDTCNNCVLHHDHHCKFLNNCVGSRNYKYFLWFLLASTLSCLMLLIISFLQVFQYKFMSHPPQNVRSLGESLMVYPAPFFLALYSTLAAVYPFLLLGLHLFLTSRNLTTREYLNYVWGKKDPDFKNVFSTHSLLKNIYINWFGKPKGISFIRTTEDYNPGDLRLERVEPLLEYL